MLNLTMANLLGGISYTFIQPMRSAEKAVHHLHFTDTMIKASTYKTPVSVVESIRYLIKLLRTEKRNYEHAAASVASPAFSQSISVLALENNQYECELSSQLQMLGAAVESEAVETNGNSDTQFDQSAQDGCILPGQILQFCRDSEKKLILAYRRILNEPFLAEGLRTLIRKQLNGVLYAFLQLKLLNTADFTDGNQAGVTGAK